MGHVFQNRFGARAIEGDAHLEAVCTYVLENPEGADSAAPTVEAMAASPASPSYMLRAGLCERPEDWPWSGREL